MMIAPKVLRRHTDGMRGQMRPLSGEQEHDPVCELPSEDRHRSSHQSGIILMQV